MKARDLAAWLLWTIAFVFVMGVSVGGGELIVRFLVGRGFPRWSLLTYIGAAFALGLGYVLAEVIWHPVGRILVDRDKVTDPLWKRSLRLLAILTVVGALTYCVMLAEGPRSRLALSSSQQHNRPDGQ
jgi:MFS family permease